MSRDVCLAFTAIEETWDSDKRLVFLGEWCKLWSRRAAWEKRDHEVMSFPWDAADKVEQALLTCREIYPEALRSVTQLLNSVHGLAKPERYYHILLGNWLEQFIHQCHDKYHALKLACREFPSATSYLLSAEDHYVPVDIADFLRVMVGDKYALQHYSDICRALPQLPLARKEVQSLRPIEPPMLRHSGGMLVFRDLVFKVLRTLSRISHGEHFIVVTQPYVGKGETLTLATLSLRSGLRISVDYMNYRLPSLPAADLRGRGDARLEPIPTELGEVIGKLVPRYLPVVFWEGYRATRECVSALGLPRKTPVFTGTGLHLNTVLKFHAAENYESVLVLDQVHGGGYGMDAIHSAKDYEKSIATKFYGSGWVQREGGYFLPSAKFSRTRKHVRESRARMKASQISDVLFSANEFPRYVYRFQFHLNSSANVTTGLPEIAGFIRALPVGLRQRVLLRVYPRAEEYGWDFAGRLREEFPQLRVDEIAVPFESRLATSRLYVTSQNGTTLLEALAADIPTVCYFDSSVYRFGAVAQEHLLALSAAGVVQHGPAAAAAFVASVYDDVEEWWNRPVVRESRAKFVEEYAATDEDWGRRWIEELGKILEN